MLKFRECLELAWGRFLPWGSRCWSVPPPAVAPRSARSDVDRLEEVWRSAVWDAHRQRVARWGGRERGQAGHLLRRLDDAEAEAFVRWCAGAWSHATRRALPRMKSVPASPSLSFLLRFVDEYLRVDGEEDRHGSVVFDALARRTAATTDATTAEAAYEMGRRQGRGRPPRPQSQTATSSPSGSGGSAELVPGY